MNKASDNGGYEAESHAATMTLQYTHMTVAKSNFSTT